ncbi:MAG: PDZ domain-containing protein [Anaerolineales bacterium]
MKKNRWLFVLLGVVVLGITLIFGAAFGAGITYFFLEAKPAQAAFTTHRVVDVPYDDQEGILVAAVEPGSPAETAGLVRGDIILEVNGNPVNNLIDLQSVLAEYAAGESVQLTVLHGDETLSLIAELSAQGEMAYLGIDTCSVMGKALRFDGQQIEEFIRRMPHGAVITEVISDSPAELAGLKVGDVIISIDGNTIGRSSGLTEMIQTYKPGDQVTLEIQSEDAETPTEVDVTLGENPDNPDQAYLGIGYQSGMGQRFFHNLDEFQGQIPENLLPEGLDQNGEFFFHRNPGSDGNGMPFLNPSQLPGGVESAVIISEVVEDSPAAEAGLQENDLILAVDDESVSDVEVFVNVMQSHKPGDQVALTVFRAGQELTVTVTLAEHPDNPELGYLGVLAGTLSIKNIELPEGFKQDFDPELPDVPGGDA